MISFKLATHTIDPNYQIVEIYRDGKFIGAIYPHESGIRIISKFLNNNKAMIDFDMGILPALNLQFDDEEIV